MPKSKDYQTLEQELDKVLADLQQPDVQVETALKLYEQGLLLLEQLEARLKQTENKIEKLKLATLKEEK